MSKSDSGELGAVFLTDAPADIERKFKRAVTDSGAEISYDEINKPGIKNLLDIQAVITGKSPSSLVEMYAGKMYGHLKADTAAIVIEELRPIQERTKQLLADRGELMAILKSGAIAARSVAHETLDRVYRQIGFIV